VNGSESVPVLRCATNAKHAPFPLISARAARPRYDDGEEEWLTMPSVDVCIIDSTVSIDEGGGRALGGGGARGRSGDESKRQLQRDSSGSPCDIAYMPQILPEGSHTTP
jgi:hypothetical protein